MKKTIITLLLTVLAVFLAASMRANTVLEGVSLPEPVKEAEPIKAKKIAKVEPKPVVAPVVAPKPVPKPAPTGTCASWMKAAGIVDTVSAYAIFMAESGCQPLRWNSAGSGAYGVCQSLPASKMASAGADYMTNPVTQMRWCDGYAKGRYGGWSQAWGFWQANRWW